MDNNKLIKHLTSIGLSDKQAIVYSTLLERGGLYPSQLANLTKLNRSTTYKTLMELKGLKLVRETEKLKKLFYFVDRPEEILFFTKNAVKEAEERHDSAERLVPRLLDFFSSNDERPKISFLGGNDIFTKITEIISTSEKSKELFAIWDPSVLSPKIDLDSLLQLSKLREKANLIVKELVPDNDYNRNYSDKTFINSKKGLAPKIRFLNGDRMDGQLFLYDRDKIVFIKQSTNNFVGLHIEDTAIFNFQKTLFDSLWSNSKD